MPKWIVKETPKRIAEKIAQKLAPKPLPSEHLVSPLREQVNVFRDTKQRTCNYNCTGCKYSTGNSCALDREFFDSIEDSADTEHWLREVYEAVNANTKSQQELIPHLKTATATQQPLNRFWWVLATIAATSVGGLVLDLIFTMIP